MNTTASHVAPEDVMALLDGELSILEASSVSAHLDECAECSQIEQRLRAASRSLATWTVPVFPNRLENSIKEAAANGDRAASKPGLFIRASFWSWKRYAAITTGAVSLLLIIAAVVSPHMTEHHVYTQRRLSLPPPEQSDLYGYVGHGSAGKLQKDGPPVAGIAGGRSPSRGLQDVLSDQSESAPMIARSVSVSIVVKDFAAARSSLDMILTRYRGYAAQLSVSTVENSPRSLQASLRIPAAVLSSALADFKSLGRVERETQSGEEVTRQHEDLVARLKNSRDTEQRLREILQQRTGKITDVLKVEEEIARVRGEIEEMEAEQQSLEHRVNFAAVELQLSEEYKAQLNPPAPPISTRFHNALVAGYQNVSETVLDILLFFTEYGPVIILWLTVLAAPVFFFWRRYRKISSAM